MNAECVYEEEELYPQQIAKIITQAGLIEEEEERMVEQYLWLTAFNGIF